MGKAILDYNNRKILSDEQDYALSASLRLWFNINTWRRKLKKMNMKAEKNLK